MNSLTAQLSGLAIVMSSVMFAVSVAYHVLGTVRDYAATMRNLYHLAIYAAIAVATVADTSLVTNDFDGTHFQTVLDPLLAASIIGAYFTTRRWLVPSSETSEVIFDDACSIGLFRFFHSDLEHASLRVVGVGTLTMAWILLVPPAFANLTVEAAGVWFSGVVTASALLVAGVLIENLYRSDEAFAKGRTMLTTQMTSHSWWHVISVVSIVIAVVGREFGVSQKT